jgi:hypothetical protein
MTYTGTFGEQISKQMSNTTGALFQINSLLTKQY